MIDYPQTAEFSFEEWRNLIKNSAYERIISLVV
jgi:hypothetical protein